MNPARWSLAGRSLVAPVVFLTLQQTGPAEWAVKLDSPAPVHSFGITVVSSVPIVSAFREDGAGTANNGATSARALGFNRYIFAATLPDYPTEGNVITFRLAFPGVVQWDSFGPWGDGAAGLIEWGPTAAGLEIGDAWHLPNDRVFERAEGKAIDLAVVLAAEYRGRGCPGDWNGDGAITLSDLAVVLAGFGEEFGPMELAITLGQIGRACPLASW